MARQPRFEYAGAVYHVMARGDGGKRIFEAKDDHESFLYWLERVCASHGWRVHAWVLMGNHFHLLLETPEPNLVSGMRMLLGTFGKAWNIRRQRQGHVFHLGEEGFKDRLLGLLDKASAKLLKKGSRTGGAVREHGQLEAEHIVSVLSAELGLPESPEELDLLKRNDPRKVICAALVKSRTAVGNDWVAGRLAMGHPSSMSQLVYRLRRDPKAAQQLNKHEKILKTKD